MEAAETRTAAGPFPRLFSVGDGSFAVFGRDAGRRPVASSPGGGPLPRAMPVHSRTRFRGPPGRCANRKESTERLYRGQMRNCFGDWMTRQLDTIARRDVEARFHLVSKRHGRSVGNHAISLLRSVYRRPSVDFDGLRNPVESWLAAGRRYHPSVRRRISAPSEVLPRWRREIEAEVIVPATRDIFWCGLYTGMRVGEVFGLRWDRVNLPRGADRRSGVPVPYLRAMR